MLPEATAEITLDQFLVESICNRLFGEEEFVQTLLRTYYLEKSREKLSFFSQRERQRIMGCLTSASEDEQFEYISEVLAKRLGNL